MKEHRDLIDTAEYVLRKVLVKMKAKPLSGKALDTMKLIESAVTNLELARLAS